jgi:hypothetical protein
MRTINISIALTATLVVMAPVASAVDQGSKTAVQKKLEAEYALTKTTDDKTDIVTAGAVMVLQKDKMLMVAATSAANPCTNTYKDGKITQNAGCKAGEKLRHLPGIGSRIPGADKAPATRNFVTGEKFWVTKIDVKDAGKEPAVVMDFFTDAISEVRYKASLTIPFKTGIPSPDDALKLVQEVVTVAPAEDAKGDAKDAKQAPAQGGQQQASAAAAAPAPSAPAAATTAEAAPAPIEPPPPPPPDDAAAAAPPTVALGQTPEEVVAALGQPVKKAKVGTKEIYFYKDLKVSFLNGKVKDIQ